MAGRPDLLLTERDLGQGPQGDRGASGENLTLESGPLPGFQPEEERKRGFECQNLSTRARQAEGGADQLMLAWDALQWLNPSMAPKAPIVLSTFGSLVRHGYRIDVHCWRCQRWAQIDAASFPPELSYIGRRFRCSCGERCSPTISMPLRPLTT